MRESVPIVLLSGMAADARLFEPQLAAFPTLRVQPWIEPLPEESLREYAARLAPLANPGQPCIVGGASFGGVVALELAQHLPALACILIGSVRTPSGLPWQWRLLRRFACFGPAGLRRLAAWGAFLGSHLLSRGTVRRLQRLSQPEAAFVRWATCAVVRWRPSTAAQRVRVFHIHGSADRILPVELNRPDVIVPGGGHALSLFSPAAVNEFIAWVVQAITLNQTLEQAGVTRSMVT